MRREPGAFAGPDGGGAGDRLSTTSQHKSAMLRFPIATRRLCRTVSPAVGDRVVRRPGVRQTASAFYGPLEARLTRRPRHHRRAGRRRVAARSAHRSVAEPADAARPRPRPAGAAHRACGSRLRPVARRARGVLTHAAKLGGAPTVASRFLQRLAAVAGAASWEAAIARGEQYRASRAALDEPAGPARPVDAAGAAPAPRRAPESVVGDRDRALAARSLHHLRQTHSQAGAARSGRRAAGRGRARQPDPRRDRGISPRLYASELPDDPGCRTAAHRPKAFRAARRFPRGARVLVAAVRAYRRDGSPNWSAAPRARSRGAHAEIGGAIPDSSTIGSSSV